MAKDQRTLVSHDNFNFTIDELTIDLGAFLRFLKVKTDFNEKERYPDLESLWMLIPKTLEVEWRKGVGAFHLEKEVFSRTIWIIAEPVEKAKEELRRAQLLELFSNVIAKDQTKQIAMFLSFLKKENLNQIREDYIKFKEELLGKTKDEQKNRERKQ